MLSDSRQKAGQSPFAPPIRFYRALFNSSGDFLELQRALKFFRNENLRPEVAKNFDRNFSQVQHTLEKRRLIGTASAED